MRGESHEIETLQALQVRGLDLIFTPGWDRQSWYCKDSKIGFVGRGETKAEALEDFWRRLCEFHHAMGDLIALRAALVKIADVMLEERAKSMPEVEEGSE